MLFYRHNLVTRSIGIVLYHNIILGRGHGKSEGKLSNSLQRGATPCVTMLKEALKLDRVHKFGDISISQILEKMDFVTELTLINDSSAKLGPKPTTLICFFSLSGTRFSFASEQDRKKTNIK